MASDPVQPLRISKGNTPSKLPRPLSEIGSTERRRNSPSYNQATRKMIVSRDSASPFETSAFRSPRAFWEKDTLSPGRFGSENSPERELSPSSPTKRSSIENLKKASRVANSPMFARESKDKYDPSSSPIIERPLTDRPLSDRIQQNPFSRYDSIRKENNPFKSPEKPVHHRVESKTEISELLPSTLQTWAPEGATPIKEPVSPTKSSLTAKSRYGNSAGFDPENGTWSGEEDGTETPLGSLRPAKSVTFQSAPPEVNEYEQQTPEPSSEATGSRESSYDSDEYEDTSFDREISAEDEDSFDASLEDTEKTPVVLPGDWANASPETARTQLVDEYDDVFDDAERGSPSPTASPSKTIRDAPISARSESVASDDSVRPLPPIPGVLRGRQSSASLSAAVERASSAQRHLVSPPRPASVSKDEILRMRETNMSLEDRMDLLALQQENKRASINILKAKKSDDTIQAGEPAEDDDLGDLPDFDYEPMISRESILRKVKSDMQNDYLDEEEAEAAQYSDHIVDYSELAKLDPDVAIPSRETSTHFDEAAAMAVKEEPEESEIDFHDVPEAVFDPEILERSISHVNHMDQRQSSVVHHDLRASLESESAYSDSTVGAGMQDQQGTGLGITHHDEFCTPLEEPAKQDPAREREMSLPLLSNFGNDFDFGLKDYMTPDCSMVELTPTMPVLKAGSEKPVLAPIATELRASLSSEEDDDSEFPLHERIISPVIPERKATIKTNGKLKARPSGSRADIEAMVASYHEEPVPTIPDEYRHENQDFSEIADSESIWSQPSAAESGESKNDSGVEQEPKRQDIQKLKLDISLPPPTTDTGAGFSLSEEMERVMEQQKKGYLMRQNTKVVIASNRNFSNDSVPSKSPGMGSNRSVPNSPRKSSVEKFIQTEPWNGKVRRKSSRRSSTGRKSHITGPAPPLPGQESALGTLDEYSALNDEDEETERGRLFVKVVAVKDLDLPLPKNDKVHFQLTLDNGLHCVTTANLDLNKSAPIGQEFELVVLQDLDFQLTLTTNLPPPPPKPQYIAAPASPTKPKSPTKSMFSRLLSSPKKRAEQERRAQAEADEFERRRQEDEQRKRTSVRPTAWDKMRELVDANTGSFGRSYVSLKSHEEQCFGRQLTVDVPLFNEWALEKDFNVVSSVRSKRGNAIGTVKRPPYTVGSLEVQLLYIPKPKDAADDAMPKSMSAAIREMAAAEKVTETKHEGALSQQGGDCPYWRRRFFKLNGTKLTAYHEHTMQPRATINLSKASRLIDDKSALVADPTSGNPSSKTRRKSAFAEEDDGYQFVEEGFRIRFANGETIDFYADNKAQKDAWMESLSKAVGKTSDSKFASWTDMVLSREKLSNTPKLTNELVPAIKNPDIRVQAPSRDSSLNTTCTKSVPSSPIKSATGSVLRRPVVEDEEVPEVPEKDEGRALVRPGTPPLEPRKGHRSRKDVKSMIF